jgi:hypothetical protein
MSRVRLMDLVEAFKMIGAIGMIVVIGKRSGRGGCVAGFVREHDREGGEKGMGMT